MNKVNLTLNEAGSLLIGAGLVQMTNDILIGVGVVVVGAILKITVAILKKKGVVISSKPQ